MIEVANGLSIGNEQSFRGLERTMLGDTWASWSVVHACKEPFHRQAVGYTERAAPKGHHEYLYAHRGHRLMLNLVDAPDPAYIPMAVIDTALAFIEDAHINNRRVLVHCNQGESRGPTIGLLYLAPWFPPSFAEAEDKYRIVYPTYNPGKGMRGFAALHWMRYHQRHARAA